ncbi:MAG: citramalate synthase [Proteobacteria bacterium]|nr:citramalate synthase [Pseudomonadota bacterium]MBI3497764.1 citramalate synthase [Pseudomonadota bacterium]
MTGRRIYLYDTTLRDGAQTQGIDFSVEDKRAIAEALDQLGLDYLEAGWPGANPTDDRLFAEPPNLAQARMVAFGMTRRAGRSAANDPGLTAVLAAGAGTVCLVGKAWDFQVEVALGADLRDNLAMIADSVAHARTRVDEVVFDAEHFFDGYKANPGYAVDCLRSALDAGAAWLVLCDTNGGTLPHEIEEVVTSLGASLPAERLGIHCHDDTGNAVANSLAAVRAGACMVQGTLNGLGERCGNANLVTLIPTLMLKMGYGTGITDAGLKQLTRVSRLLDERLNRAPDRQAPYVGESAFAHKGGLHAAAVARDARAYEHIEPERVGNRRHVVVSDQSGRANLVARFREIGLEVKPDHPGLVALLETVKAREAMGYAYDGAEASFELLARRALEDVPHYFTLKRFRVMDERRYNAKGALVTESEATVTVGVGNELRHEVAVGNGPVNALDTALRKALAGFYGSLDAMRLVDYKVRILTPSDGTGAVTRVMIESGDGHGARWTTVGVSANIIDASVDALFDGITYKLMRDGAKVGAGA